MKKKTVIICVVLVIPVLLVISFIHHRIQLSKENTYFVTNGKTVRVNDHNMNVYIGGNENSRLTLVFMSGAGTCSPVLDFKSLYSLYEKEYRVAVVEKAGYGFSEISNAKRDVDTMLQETRASLAKAGIENKEYILFPHSMSAIEALYWANTYPQEIKGIIGLDPAVPRAYKDMKFNFLLMRIAKFASDIGITRFFPAIAKSSAAIQDGNLTNDEKKLYEIIFYKRTMTKSMLNETKLIKKNAEKLEKIDTTNVFLLFFISNGNGTGFNPEAWHTYLTDYVNKKNGLYKILNCSHYVHNIEFKKIYDESIPYIHEINK